MVPLFNKVKSIARIKILDWYIFKQFLVAFFFIVLNFTLVICMIDLVEKNGDFIKNKPSLNEVLFDYYLNYIPYMANLLSPITIFIAAVYITSRLASRVEVIAILSSGVSFLRFLLPYVTASSFLAVIIYFLIGYTIPDANKGRLAFEYKYVNGLFRFEGRNIHLKIGPGTFIYLQSYNNIDREGYNCTLEEIEGTTLLKKLKAEKLIWVPEKKNWRLLNVRIFDFKSKPNSIVYKTSVDTIINLKTNDFESQHLLHERLTNSELEKHIATLKFRGADNVEGFLVEKYLRTTYPFSIIILTVIGVLLSAKKSREGAGLKIVLGFILAFVYIMFHVVCRTIAQTGSLDPLLACWLPNLVFIAIGIALYFTLEQ